MPFQPTDRRGKDRPERRRGPSAHYTGPERRALIDRRNPGRPERRRTFDRRQEERNAVDRLVAALRPFLRSPRLQEHIMANRWPFRRIIPTVHRVTFHAILPATEVLLVEEAQRGTDYLRTMGFHIEAIGIQGAHLTIIARTTLQASLNNLDMIAAYTGHAMGAISCRPLRPIEVKPFDPTNPAGLPDASNNGEDSK